jgi:hypothetical protein
MTTNRTTPRIYSILEFCLAKDGKTLTHELHLVAACSQKEAVAAAKHEGIDIHSYCFITNDVAADMGGSTIRDVTSFKSDVIGVAEFERWRRIMTGTEKGIQGVYTQLG